MREFIGTLEFASEIGFKSSSGLPHTKAVMLISRLFRLDLRGMLRYMDRKWYISRHGRNFWRETILPALDEKFDTKKKFTVDGSPLKMQSVHVHLSNN